jgi:acylphosphatase
MSMTPTRLHVFITGRVQGVFFRANTQSKAQELGLTGWVRNLRDGRVEAVFEGPRPAVEAVLAWCQKGPPGSVVNTVEEHWKEPTGEFKSFSIEY